MPILQPIQMTIHPEDFQDKAYGFVVESVLTEKAPVGLLTISVSTGYLLTTSQNREPRREQFIDYLPQTDGSWLADANVTLFATENSLVNGSVIIRNSLAETVVLTVDASSTSLIKPQPAGLALNQPRLTFAQTSPGKPSFLIYKVPQLPADAVVKLTTDTPEYFQLASDSRPTFLPDLILAPSSGGTSVHVRYSANKAGLHTGQLLIHTEYENQAIALEGRSTGLLPAIRPISLRPVIQRQPISKKRVRLVALVMVSGLLGVAYFNRYQLFPALYNDAKVSEDKIQSVSLPEVPASTDKLLKKPELKEKTSALTETRQKSKSSDESSSRAAASAEPTTTRELTESNEAPGTEAEIGNSDSRRRVDKERITDQPASQANSPKSLTLAEEESDLEKELNQKP